MWIFVPIEINDPTIVAVQYIFSHVNAEMEGVTKINVFDLFLEQFRLHEECQLCK